MTNGDNWEVLGEWAGGLPGVSAVSPNVPRSTVQRMLGFWLLWHIHGGLKPGVKAGAFALSSSYRLMDEFVDTFGVDVDSFATVWASAIRESVRESMLDDPRFG